MFKHFPFIHNHGDFVHLDALRDWLRGVVSLESFLGHKNDNAIVKDMHFIDEYTSVDYIDTTDNTEKSEVLCRYLTSDAFDETDNTQFKKVDKIRFKRYPNQEKVVSVHQKDNTTGSYRDIIRSNVPIAYDATDDFFTSNHATHMGIFDHGIKIYDDDYNKTSLPVKVTFNFCAPIAIDATDNYTTSDKAYYVGVNENGIKIYNADTKEVVQRYQYKDNFTVESLNVTDVNPFGSCYETETGSTINATLHQPAVVTNVNGTIIDGQFMYELETPVTIQPGKSVTLSFLQSSSAFGGLGDRKFSKNFFAKHIEVLSHDGQANNGVITTLSRDKNYPIGHGNISVVLFNTTDLEKTFDTFLFTF